MDRISNLPDDVIFHIVSFLSAKDAARTRIVSKNLKNLITIIPDLVFDQPINDTESGFELFADSLLARHASHRIRRLSLKLQPENISQYSNLVVDFLRNVLNRGVFDLDVEIMFSFNLKRDYSLPFKVFTCNTVVKMRLGSGFVFHVLPENASLPALKTLTLDGIRFDSDDSCVFTRLLSACPLLEELNIYDFYFEQWRWSRVVSSVTLKRLTIRCGEESNRDCWYGIETISFDTPNLTYLDYDDIVPHEYPIVNLNSLIEAHLYLVQRVDNNPTNLIKGLKNVQFLTLDSPDAVQLFEDFSEAVPVFENMTHLSIATYNDLCWDGLKLLVKKSPNLKTLTIAELRYRDPDLEDVCECLLSIEVLKIKRFTGDDREIAQIKQVLQKLPCLELLEVHVPRRKLSIIRDEKKLQILVDLLKLPRASSKCKVEVKFLRE